MEIKIIEKKENTLMMRVELKFSVTHAGEKTPTREAVRKMLGKNLNVKLEQVIIDHMRSEFGKTETIGYAKIYDTVEQVKKIEPDYILLRHNLIDKKTSK